MAGCFKNERVIKTPLKVKAGENKKAKKLFKNIWQIKKTTYLCSPD